jgi:hypothetical protein
LASSTLTKCCTEATIPKIAGLASCTTDECTFFKPKLLTVARFAGFWLMVLRSRVIFIFAAFVVFAIFSTPQIAQGLTPVFCQNFGIQQIINRVKGGAHHVYR